MSTVMTQIPDERLVALADTYHTPLYVFEEAVIRKGVKSAFDFFTDKVTNLQLDLDCNLMLNKAAESIIYS